MLSSHWAFAVYMWNWVHLIRRVQSNDTTSAIQSKSSSIPWWLDKDPAQLPVEWLHPDDTPASAADAEQEACYTSWTSYIKYLREPGVVQTARMKPITTTSVLVWETLKSFGINTTYTDCDDIPRLKFIGTPTSTSASLVTVTVWSDDTDTKFWQRNDTDDSEPTCTRLNPSHCRNIFGAREVGGFFENKFPVILYPTSFYKVCPVEFSCIPVMDEVVLIYWPESIATRDVCAAGGRGSSKTHPWTTSRGSILKTDAITFRGQDLYLRSINGVNWNKVDGKSLQSDLFLALQPSIGKPSSPGPYLTSWVLRGDFTFTSPTVYLAHRAITRELRMRPLFENPTSAGWTKREVARPPGTIPLSASDIFTLRPINQTVDGLKYAKLVAKGLFTPSLSARSVEKKYEARTLDFGDLRDPVPASVYYDARILDCWGQQSHCGTITDDSYRPKLRIAPHIWKSVFGGFMCMDPMLVDPPISLYPLPEDELEPFSIRSGKLGQTAATPTPVPGSSQSTGEGSATRNEARPGDHRSLPYPAETRTPESNLGLQNGQQDNYGISSSGLRGGTQQLPSGSSPGDWQWILLSEILRPLGWRYLEQSWPNREGIDESTAFVDQYGQGGRGNRPKQGWKTYTGGYSRLQISFNHVFTILFTLAWSLGS